ncbi:MAG TPA: hypothetical protein VNN80_10265 [Polyangiaceae bacterium]|nr:hypothetical protein [Polyangiaceae bacterium]
MAEALFRQGRELMAAGNYTEACPKFAESHRLDPGGGTLLNLAVCHEGEGKLATAWGEFQEALALAQADGRKDRISLAEERIAVIEPELARLTVTLPATPPENLVVSVNGTPLGAAAWGAPMPVDAGSVRIEASAPDRQEFVKSVDIRDGENIVVEIPVLSESLGGDAGNGPSDSGLATSGEPNHAAAYVVGGLGLAAIGVGSYFGVQALHDSNEADDLGCDDDGCPTEKAHQAEKNAVFNGWLATAGIGAGLAAVGVAIYLYVDEEAEHSEAGDVAVLPSAGPRGAGLDVVWVY